MSIEAKITPRKALVILLATVVINMIIAVFLTGIGFGGGIFQINLIYSQSIGLASLLETDLDPGKQMLTDLTTYLRTSLARSREGISTLGDEIDSINAYINIFSIRLGDRLTVEIDVPEKLRHHKFPPMLLQPLVENALLHGIDPKIEGGRLRIAAESDNGRLRLEVADTGIGLTNMPAKNGVGITNTRERLNGLYGEKGILRITENQPSGLKIYIEVPGETDSRDNR